MKVYVLKNPTSQIPVGIFSTIERANEMLKRLFVNVVYTEGRNCIDEFEVDPLKDLMDGGLYPWVIKIDILENEAFTESLGGLESLFDKEELIYNKNDTGKYAIAHVFAKDAEEAESKALKLWSVRQQEGGYIKAGSSYHVSFGSNGDIMSIDRKIYYYYNDNPREDELNITTHSVEVCITTDDIMVAINRAKEMYNEWINKELEAWDA